MLVDGERESVVRPPVQIYGEDGNSNEVVFSVYEAARDPSQLKDSILTALSHGVSTRDIEKLNPNSPGVKKSSVSVHWKSVGHKFVEVSWTSFVDVI